jgi:hypothetical protein
MGRFHHSKKHHGDKKKSSSSRLKYDLTQAGRRKLPEDFLYTQNHKSIWNSFSNFLDENFAEEDLSEILDEDEVTRIKTAPAIPLMLQFEPQTPGEEESEESKRARARGQSLADKSYAGREAQYFDRIKKLAAKFSRATVLVLKHTDTLINLDMHQFLKSDPVKCLDPASTSANDGVPTHRWMLRRSKQISLVCGEMT